MENGLEKTTEEQRIKIYRTIKGYFDKRGLDIEEVRKAIGTTPRKKEGLFLNLVIKDTRHY